MVIVVNRRKHHARWSIAALGASLEAWYDAATIGAANNATVLSWSDISPNGKHLTCPSGKATYKTAQINGLPCVQSVDNLDVFTPASTLFSGATSVSAFYVIKTTGVGRGAVFEQTVIGGGSHEPWTDGNCYLSLGTTHRKTVTSPPALTSFRIISLRASTTWKYNVDGSSYASVANTFANPASNSIKLGYIYSGLIAEIVLCASSLSDSDAQKAEGYLAHKYGLTSNLPVSHPYKTTAP